LPNGTKPIGNVPEAGGRLQVNLSVQPGDIDEPAEFDRLFTQLAWSLPNLDGKKLELKIQGQSRRIADVDSYLRTHPVYQVASGPSLFAVFAGKVLPLFDPAKEPQPAPIVPEANRDVVSAGFARRGDRVVAALVTEGAGGQRLLVGSGTGIVSELTPRGRSYGSMDRPVWLKSGDPENPVGLVVADGRLYRFGTDRTFSQVQLPGAPGKLTVVSAALDGHRIAFIADGGLYVAAVAVDGGRVIAGPARRLATSLRELTAVDWSGENMLVLAGVKANNRVALYDLTVDAADERTPVVDNLGSKVTHISAYPDNPVVRASLRRVMYEANDVSSFSNGERINPDQVVGVPERPSVGESGKVTVPFFVY
jgi:hypothetical protein